MIKGEGWVNHPEKLDLKVIPCLHYNHSTPYNLPVRPSPNLPDARSVLLYPSLGLFEGTNISVGRGTDFPFQVLGHPEFNADTFSFVPRPNAGAKKPPHQGWICKGYDLRGLSVDSLRKDTQLELHWLLDFYRAFPNKPIFFIQNNFFELLAGTRDLRKQIIAGKSEDEIRAGWQEDLAAYRNIRKKYLIYRE
jgi:uncharacterized protein YbbC (DUF1343 family)